MKQIIVLEKAELEKLRKGRTLVLNTMGGEIGIQFEHESPKAESGEDTEFKCPRKKCGKAFSSEKALTMHTWRAHDRKFPAGG